MKTKNPINETNPDDLTIEEQIEEFAEIIIGHLLKQMHEKKEIPGFTGIDVAKQTGKAV